MHISKISPVMTRFSKNNHTDLFEAILNIQYGVVTAFCHLLHKIKNGFISAGNNSTKLELRVI